MVTSYKSAVVVLLLGLLSLALFHAATPGSAAAAPGASAPRPAAAPATPATPGAPAAPAAPLAPLGKPRPTMIMVVDINEVLKKSDERSAIEANFTALAEKLQDEERKKVKEINDMQDAMDKVFTPGSDAWMKEEERREQKALEYQGWVTYQRSKMAREKVTQMAYLYRKILDAIATAAKNRGADLVLFKEPEVNFRDVKPEAVSAIIQVRKVLYSADDLDLTTVVWQDMNNAYKASPKATTKTAND